MERRISAILVADVVGYSRLMEADEIGTLTELKAHRTEFIELKISKHNGRLVKLMGDGLLVEFASVVDSVACAVDIQRGMANRNAPNPERTRIEFRIGINLGDVIVEGDDIYGEGVNVAARLEGLADPGGICISGTAYDQLGRKVDAGYEYLGERSVKNISEPVRAYRVLMQPAAAGKVIGSGGKRRLPILFGALAVFIALILAGAWWQFSAHGNRMPLSDEPSIAVLPFDNLSGDQEQGYFSDGITEDLTTDVSRISGLFVVARHTMLTYRDRVVSVQKVGDELGVQYVLDGSVRRAGDRVRINAQLIDARSGQQLWAERWDRKITDVFALQDDVTRKIVSALAVKLTPSEKERLGRARQVNPEAYDLLLRGLERYRRYTRETNLEARAYFERAAALDPGFARAYADIGLTHADDVFHGWTDKPEESAKLALDMARTALKLDENSRLGHWLLAFTNLILRNYDEALKYNRRALALDPNYADNHAQRAVLLNYLGRSEEALPSIQAAMRMNPRYPFLYNFILGQSHFFLQRTDQAITQFKNTIGRNPGLVIGRKMLAAAYAHAGMTEEAQWETEEVLTLDPNVTLASERLQAPHKNPEYLAYYIDGLRKAGFPD